MSTYKNIPIDTVLNLYKKIESDRYLRAVEKVLRMNWTFLIERWREMTTIPDVTINQEVLGETVGPDTIREYPAFPLAIMMFIWLVMKKAQPQAEWYLYEATVDGEIRYVFPVSMRDNSIVDVWSTSNEVDVDDVRPLCQPLQLHTIMMENDTYPLEEVPPNIEDTHVYIDSIRGMRGTTDKEVETFTKMVQLESDIIGLGKTIVGLDRAETFVQLVLLYKETKVLQLLLKTYPNRQCK